jgi:recombination protein RecT
MANELTVIEKQKTLATILDTRRAEIAKVLPKHLTPERLIRICLSAASRNPVLLECSHESLLKSIMTAGQLGIEPDGVLGMGHLVPFKNNKTQKMEATFILGYRGCLDLARRSGDVQTIETGVVHAKDKFEIEFGLDRKLRHIPAWELADPGETIAVYAIATLSDGTKQIEVMSRAQIDAIRSRSKAGNFGPWVSDYDEMARKTVVKRITKTLPLSIEFREEIVNDESREFSQDVIDIIPVQEPVDKSTKIA